ncbi:MAG: FMN-binding protein [Candidatus Limnocylindrales bacterium]
MVPRRGLIALSLTAIALVLLLNFKTPQMPVGLGPTGVGAAPPTAGISSTVPSSLYPNIGPTTTSAVAGSSGPPSASPTTPHSPVAASGQATGQVSETRFGPVQVRISYANGKITDVVAVQVPSDRFRSQMIAAYAVPILRTEALQAQSAQIDTVSGATYTSQGYAMSLQSALDQAHL